MIDDLPTIRVSLDASTCGLIGETIATHLAKSASYMRYALDERAEGWLDTKAAAAYAGCSTDALHRATAARAVRFEQQTEGGKCYFKREWIDAWRAGLPPDAPSLRAV